MIGPEKLKIDQSRPVPLACSCRIMVRIAFVGRAIRRRATGKMIQRLGPGRDRPSAAAQNLARRCAAGAMFLILIGRKGSPEFPRDRAIFAVDFDDELVGPLKARECGGIPVKLLRYK
jgi:hypothetical protein